MNAMTFTKLLYMRIVTAVALCALVVGTSPLALAVDVPETPVVETPVATVHFTKIVCTDESLLPNGAITNPVTEATASEFLNSSPERESGCSLESGWEFQWNTNPVSSGDVDQMAADLGGDWNTTPATDDNGKVTIELTDEDLQSGSHLSLRESFQTGYIPFTRHSDDEGSDVSAEFYCHEDVKNYDNSEWITDVAVGNEYHCVAWNVPVDDTDNGDSDDSGNGDDIPVPTVEVCKMIGETPFIGWDITMTNGDAEDDINVKTGEDGCVDIEFDPMAGPWDIIEEPRAGYEQVNIDIFPNFEAEILFEEGEKIPLASESPFGPMITVATTANPTGNYPHMCHIPLPYIYAATEFSESELLSLPLVGVVEAPAVSCTFFNRELEEVEEVEEEETSTGGTTTGTRVGSRSNRVTPTPTVLGVATTTETVSATSECTMYLTEYLQMGDNNSMWEVLKLQLFLASQEFFMMNVGVFDEATFQAVKTYQANNAEATLQPWVEAGIVSELAPTGNVYKTTRHTINNTVCPGSESMPTLP